MNSKTSRLPTLGNVPILFWVNAFLYFAFTVLSLFSFPEERLFRITYSLIILIIVFPLTGLNFSLLVEKLCKQSFSSWEKWSIGAFSLLFVSPILLTAEFTLFDLLRPEIPLINSACLFLLTSFFVFRTSTTKIPFPTLHQLLTYFRPAFILATFFYFALILSITTAYYPLPDVDPYGWMSNYTERFGEGAIAAMDQYRPLFSSLVYILNQSALIDMYAIFKYVLPFFTLLVLFPAGLLTRKLTSFWSQLAALFMPLASASVILYFQTPIPQALFNICLTYYVFFLLYSWFSGKRFFHFLAGAIIFISYFYHEISAILFVLWILPTLYCYRKNILLLIKSKSAIFFLLLLLFITYSSSFLFPMYRFIASGMQQIWHAFLSSEVNLYYPASYINVDGISVGWSGWQGVLKYYGFYVGPTVFFSLGVLLLSWRYREKILGKGQGVESIVLLLSLATFFTIAEIFPRFLNLSMLPERAWGFTAFFLLAWTLVFFRYAREYSRVIAILFLFTILINVGGALYINSLKRFIITESQIESTEWIKTNLPTDRLLFTFSSSKNFILTHSQSSTKSVKDPDFYSNINVFEKYLEEYLHDQTDYKAVMNLSLDTMTKRIQALRNASLPSDLPSVLENIDNLSRESDLLRQNIELAANKKPEQSIDPIYIYYARVHPQNPYGDRPYFSQSEENASRTFVFDQYPEHFERVYAVNDDEIVIWKMKMLP